MKGRLPPSLLKTIILRGASLHCADMEDLPEAKLIAALLAYRILDTMVAECSRVNQERRNIQKDARRFFQPGGEVELWAEMINLDGDFLRLVVEKSGHEWRQKENSF